jgi:phosphoglycerate dehydrogenase-like enzyme
MRAMIANVDHARVLILDGAPDQLLDGEIDRYREAFFAAATAVAAARRLRVVGQSGSGTNNIDLAAADRYGVVVTHTPGSNAAAVAEFVLAQLLAMLRGLVTYQRTVHDGVWRTPVPWPVRQLSELTLGIVGYGHIGRAVAAKAECLGMTVRVLRRGGSLEDLLRASDVVTLHVPLTPETRHLLGRRELARCADQIGALLAGEWDGVPVVSGRPPVV